MSSALNPQPLDGDEEPYIVENDKIVSISKFQVRSVLLILYYLSTYLTFCIFCVCQVKHLLITYFVYFQSKVYLLSADSSTYLNDIEENLRLRYTAWLDSLKNYEFNPLSNEKLTKLLLSNSRLKENYDKLVPEQVR